MNTDNLFNRKGDMRPAGTQLGVIMLGCLVIFVIQGIVAAVNQEWLPLLLFASSAGIAVGVLLNRFKILAISTVATVITFILAFVYPTL
jgi:hypothetical protein